MILAERGVISGIARLGSSSRALATRLNRDGSDMT